jgi:hypothetical protein
MSRVCFVRLLVDGATRRAEVAGVRHHQPVTVPVPLSTAARLISHGTPLVVRRAG